MDGDYSIDAVDEFIKITGSSRSVAKYAIELFDGDLNVAVDQYYLGNSPDEQDIVDGKSYDFRKSLDFSKGSGSRFFAGSDSEQQIAALSDWNDIDNEKASSSHLTKAQDASENSLLCSMSDLAEMTDDYLRSFDGDVHSAVSTLLETASSTCENSAARNYIDALEGDIWLGIENLVEANDKRKLISEEKDLFQSAQIYLGHFHGDFERAISFLWKVGNESTSEMSENSMKEKVRLSKIFLTQVNFDLELAFNVLVEIYSSGQSDEGESTDLGTPSGNHTTSSKVEYYGGRKAVSAVREVNVMYEKCDNSPAAFYSDAFHGDFDDTSNNLSQEITSTGNDSNIKAINSRPMEDGVDEKKYCPCGNTDWSIIRPYFYQDTDTSESEFIGYFCRRCDHEWLISDVLDHSVEKDSSNGFQMFNLSVFKKEKVEACKCVSMDLKVLDNLYDLKKGDQFAIKRPWGYTHYGVVNQIFPAANEIEGFHWQKDSSDGRAKIKRGIVKVLEESGTFCKVEHLDCCRLDPVKLVIARACSLVGEMGYNAFLNNCEHFSNFCKTGGHKSSQVEIFFEKVKDVANKWFKKDSVKNALRFLLVKGKVAIQDEVAKVNAGAVIILEGKALVIKVMEEASRKNRGDISYNEFVVNILMTAIMSMKSIVLGVSAGNGGTFFAKYMLYDVLISSIIGKTVGLQSAKKFNAVLSAFLNGIIAKVIGYDCRAVENINSLEKGDHVIYYGGLTYPRCHGIVIQHNDISHVTIVRSTASGIIKEEVKFGAPFYKVEYEEGTAREGEETVARCLSKVGGENEYNLFTNNGKHFAWSCKKLL